MDIEEAKRYLKKNLTEKRYKHSLGAMKAAKELAKTYGENENQAEFAGLIHDIAKELSKDEIELALKKYEIIPDEIEKEQISLLHSKLGAAIAKEKFNVSEKIQKAIEYHTTGNKNMDTFAKIIYLADKIEETRDYSEVESLRELAKKDLDKAILFVLDFTIQKSVRKGRLIHPATTDLRNYLLIKILHKSWQMPKNILKYLSIMIKYVKIVVTPR